MGVPSEGRGRPPRDLRGVGVNVGRGRMGSGVVSRSEATSSSAVSCSSMSSSSDMSSSSFSTSGSTSASAGVPSRDSTRRSGKEEDGSADAEAAAAVGRDFGSSSEGVPDCSGVEEAEVNLSDSTATGTGAGVDPDEAVCGGTEGEGSALKGCDATAVGEGIGVGSVDVLSRGSGASIACCFRLGASSSSSSSSASRFRFPGVLRAVGCTLAASGVVEERVLTEARVLPGVLVGVKSSFFATLAAACIPFLGVGLGSSGEGANTFRF